ncbi:hypothetical protein [Actinomadura sp. SCN-SB]|uniref:hypothetical protein n=1 Tax=Actinomadura sp. SCN-SB TaxID=3373092 RepID=UPI00375105F5
MNDGKTSGDGIAEFYGWQRPGPRDLYSWDVPDLHACGVTDDPAIAAGHVQEVLQRAQVGTVGTVRHVTAAHAAKPSSWRAQRTERGVSWVSKWKDDVPNGEAVGGVRPVR